LDLLRAQPVVFSYLHPAWQHLLWTRAACPFLADAHLQLGALCFLAGDPLADEQHLKRAEMLASYDRYALFVVGQMDVDSGRTEAGYGKLRRSWMVEPFYKYQIFRFAVARLGLPETIEKVVPPWPRELIEFARSIYGTQPDKVADRNRFLDRAAELLQTAPMPEAERLHLQAEIHQLKGEVPQAVTCLFQALELQPTVAAWRYELSQLLARQGRLAEAKKQAVHCAQQEPARPEYVEFAKRIQQSLASAKTLPP
jgi:tetratricopeptide (TPR) repeat protein